MMTKKQDTEIIYYNVAINAGVAIGTNVYTFNSNAQTLAYYTIKLQSPIINNPSNYYMTVVSFDIPMQNQPIKFITGENILLPLTYPATGTLYYVTLSFNGSSVTENIVWQPENLTNVALFYALYTVQHFLNLINTAFLQAYNALKVLQPSLPSNYAPYYIYVSSNYTISLITDFVNYNSNNVNGISIYLNTELYNLFFNLPGQYVNNSNSTNLNYKLLVNNDGSNLYDQTGTNTILYYDINSTPPVKIDAIVCIMPQEFSTIWNLCTIESLLIKSSLPVQTEGLSAQLYNSSFLTSSQNLSSNGNFDNILTDFKLGSAVNEMFPSSRQRLTYANQNTKENRSIQMRGESTLDAIDISIFLQDRYGNLFPLYLNNGSAAFIKLAFMKKDIL